MLRDKKWALNYTSDDGSLAEQFYIPALTEAVRYDRGTGYFSASSLAGNMRGIEGLIRNAGRMRLLVGCTLDSDEIEAVRRGEDLREQVTNNLCRISLNPPDDDTKNGLELMSWMIAKNHMDVQVAIKCDDNGLPLKGAIYHKKMGVVVDRAGDKIAWSGSNNETHHGQSLNSETMSVYTSWRHPEHQQATEIEFEKDWSGRNGRLAVMDVPEAVRRRILKHAPPKGRLPARLSRYTKSDYNMVWSFITQSHKIKNGDMVGLATAPVMPWPHQVQVFRRLRSCRPARLLIADEVGLGKTIQAGLYLRQAWLEGRRRILIMAPAGLTKQWQIELREKLNLDWPIYHKKTLIWQDTHAGGKNREKSPDDWTAHGPVIISSQLARRSAHADAIAAAEWDIVVLDEAHYARQTEPNNPKKHIPNQLLKLMRKLKGNTADLILLTATPMQLHPVELYDLLELLGVPQNWNWENFKKFYDTVRNLDASSLQFFSRMFQASESEYGKIDQSKLGALKIRGKKAIKTLEGDRTRKPLSEDYKLMKEALLLCAPVARLVSRNTRRHLRDYIKANNLDWRLGTRNVCDEFIRMSNNESKIYDDVKKYISTVWNTHKETNRGAVGFVLTMYRKRLTSSLAALKKTLENHLERLDGKTRVSALHEGEYDDEDGYEDAGKIVKLENDALKNLDRDAVCGMLDIIRDMPQDTKLCRLIDVIADLRDRGYKQVMLFTQFIDTMDFLRERLRRNWSVMCYSGRHGEEPRPNGKWKRLSREETKAKFLDGSVDVLLCTDAAAEGLNFQFCGAMINYDMPWNPMKVEQRIGRIDRIGQVHDTIRIINMYYDDTIEAKVYRALRKRINLFENVVGPLQPVLAELDRIIANEALEGGDAIPPDVEQIMDKPNTNSGLDLDAMLAAETAGYLHPESPVTMEDLGRMAGNFMSGKMEPAGRGQYNMIRPTGERVRITVDRSVFENHGDSMEFWSPGSPAFPESGNLSDTPKYDTLKQLLDSLERQH